MIFDFMTYGLLASIFIVNMLRMFIDKPNKAFQTAELPWQRLLKRRQKHIAKSSEVQS